MAGLCRHGGRVAPPGTTGHLLDLGSQDGWESDRQRDDQPDETGDPEVRPLLCGQVALEQEALRMVEVDPGLHRLRNQVIDRASEMGGVVHQDRDLHSVAEVELGEQSRYMRLDCRLAHEEGGSDLSVGGACGPAGGRRRLLGAAANVPVKRVR